MREALAPFREAVRLAPNDVHHLANLGRVLVKTGEMEEGRDSIGRGAEDRSHPNPGSGIPEYS